MMRAWLESAAAGGAPEESANNPIARMEGISLREVIVHPLKGTRPISLDGWKAEQVAYKRVCNYGLPKERQRQAETAQSSLRSFWAVAWQSLGPGPSERAAV